MEKILVLFLLSVYLLFLFLNLITLARNSSTKLSISDWRELLYLVPGFWRKISSALLLNVMLTAGFSRLFIILRKLYTASSLLSIFFFPHKDAEFCQNDCSACTEMIMWYLSLFSINMMCSLTGLFLWA